MSAIVLFAMHEDEARMRKIVEALLHEKLDFWWERPEAGEGGWDRSIQTVMEARSVVFFWSAASLGEGGAAYRALAKRALVADKAISVRLERVKVPEDFRDSTVIDLYGWRRGAKDVFLLDLASAAKAKAAGLDPPPLRGPAKVMFRRLAVALPTILFAIGLFSTFKGLYSGFGLDNIATRAERHDWAALRPGSCEDLRVFLANHPDGANSGRAKTMLATRREWTQTTWRAVEKPLPLYVTRGAAETKPDEHAAMALARTRAMSQAQTDCQAFAETGSFRFLTASVQVNAPHCEPLSGGIVCGVEGISKCGLQEKAQAIQEQCGQNLKQKKG
jgi:hypothetical protein